MRTLNFLDLSFSLILASLGLFLSELNQTYYYSLLGIPHIALALIYHRRAQKLRLLHVVAFFSIFLLFWKAYTLVLGYRAIVIIASILFTWHFWIDEIKLQHLPRSRALLILGVLNVLAVASTLVEKFYLFNMSEIFLIAITLTIFILFWFRNLQINTYLGVITIALVLSYFINEYYGSPRVIGFIIIFHFINWHMATCHKLEKNPSHRKRFFYETIIWHLISGGMFYLFFTNSESFRLTAYLYSPGAFLCWSIAHVLISFSGKESEKKVFLPQQAS